MSYKRNTFHPSNSDIFDSIMISLLVSLWYDFRNIGKRSAELDVLSKKSDRIRKDLERRLNELS